MERFWNKVDMAGDCWIWTGAHIPQGYGVFRLTSQKTAVAHRVAYELLVGPIPEGAQLDHLCRRRDCVNPDHLEPVTGSENVQRGLTSKRVRMKAVCKYGHPFTPENTGTWGGKRYCRTCRNAWTRRYRSGRPTRAGSPG